MATGIRLDDRVVLVTGASRGLGRGYAVDLAGRGAAVALNGRDPDRLDEVRREIEDGGGRAVVAPGDVGVPGIAEDVLAAAAALGPLDAVVNNAAINRDRTVAKMSDEEWSEVMHAGLDGTFRVCRAVVRAWRAAGRGGRIVNTASVAGLYGNVGQANYAASKAGVIGFSLSLAREVAPAGITVNVVSPRAVTDMSESIPEERRRAFYDMQSRTNTLGRPGTPADVAPVVAFLCSEESAYLTGQSLVVTGTPGSSVG
ncbi:estradiol 17-beta-dehydrogenase 8-like [Herrania umbratica]|uniref:Estradiol 17-beta-dehydrogenase 8-like n=1 Tax=Herrania umbratica TaxID=108875 RepID=A0A6J1BMH0_9ROSI|nr:estradiol 17-beta-dehydrogenase 8-like [Herrania umbratica]